MPPDKQQAGSKRKVSAGPAPGTKNAVARPHLLVSLKPSRGGLVPCWVGKSEGAPSAQTYQPEALVVGAEVSLLLPPLQALQHLRGAAGFCSRSS